MIIGPPYLQRNDWAVPIITSRVIGVVGSNAPPTISTVYGKAYTDKNGHYVTILPKASYYIFLDGPKKKNLESMPTISRLVEVVRERLCCKTMIWQ